MSKRGKTDWAAVRLAFVSSKLSYASVAGQFGLAKTTVLRKARAENWKAQRDAFHVISLRTQAEAEGRFLAEGVQQCISVAKAILERLVRFIAEADDIPIRDYRSLTGTLKDIMDVMQSDLDIQKKKADTELAQRRLGEGEDRTVRIVISGGDDYDQ